MTLTTPGYISTITGSWLNQLLIYRSYLNLQHRTGCSRQTSQGPPAHPPPPGVHRPTCCLVYCNNQIQYDRLERRPLVPKFAGLKPALWSGIRERFMKRKKMQQNLPRDMKKIQTCKQEYGSTMWL